MNQLEMVEYSIKFLKRRIKKANNYTRHFMYGERQAVNIALQALQEKVERENPQPLTLEELRHMDNEPVWFETGEISINEQTLGKWAIITELTDKALWITTAVMPRYGNAWKYDSYGKTWLAYKYKPKEDKK